MPIDHGSPQPLYKQLAAIIRADIASGKIVDRMASIRDMAADYDLAEVTVRAAIAVLKEEGLVVTVPGRGTFVAPRTNGSRE